MTRGKKAASDMPRNQRRVKMPPKFWVEAARIVKQPKQNIRIGITLAGLKRLPSMAKGGAKMTYGMKKIDSSKLYCPGLKLRSK